MINNGNNNYCLLEKWLQLQQEEKFDLLIQGTVQCDYSVHSTHQRSQDSKDHIVKLQVFSKLMLEGNVGAVVHQVTQCVYVVQLLSSLLNFMNCIIVNQMYAAYPLFNVTHTSTKPLLVTVELDQAPVNMEVDTGASVSLISKDIYDKLWPNLTTALPLQKPDILFWTYTGEHLHDVGSVSVDVRYKEHIAHLH